MSKKQDVALLGYTGIPEQFELPGGLNMAAPEVVGLAAQAYMAANPGLDVSQTTAAWNNLDEARRREWCEKIVEDEAGAVTANAAAIDQADVLAGVAPEAAKGLGEELIDVVLEALEKLKRPWKDTTEYEQGEIIRNVTTAVQKAVTNTIRTLATRGSHHLVCELEQITVKKGAKAVLLIPKGALDQELLDGVGGPVLLVIGDSLKEAQTIVAPKPKPDQGDLLDGDQGGGGGGGGDAPSLPPADGNGAGVPDDGTVQHAAD